MMPTGNNALLQKLFFGCPGESDNLCPDAKANATLPCGCILVGAGSGAANGAEFLLAAELSAALAAAVLVGVGAGDTGVAGDTLAVLLSGSPSISVSSSVLVLHGGTLDVLAGAELALAAAPSGTLDVLVGNDLVKLNVLVGIGVTTGAGLSSTDVAVVPTTSIASSPSGIPFSDVLCGKK